MTLLRSSPRAGLTLFEVLIALACLSIISGAILILRPTPSPTLQLNQMASVLAESAASTRHQAVLNESRLGWQEEVLDCQAQPVDITFYPDGSADAAEICLFHDGQSMRLVMDVLTGQLVIDRE